MPQYKIFAQVLLMLSVINFALAAPVISQDHEVRVQVSAENTAKDGPYANNPLSGLGLRGFLSPSPGSQPMSTPTHNTPPADVSPQIEPPPDRSPSPSFASWLPPDSHTGSESWSSGSGWQSVSEHSLGGSNSDQHHTSNPQDLLSTAESRPPSLGQTGHPPPPPSEPGLSTRPRPPPATDDVKDAARIIMAISKQGFRPRTYGSGTVDANKGELVGTRH